MPSDAAIIKGFQKYEEAMNIALAVLRETPEKAIHGMGLPLEPEIEALKDDIFTGHSAYRKIANAAYWRKHGMSIKLEGAEGQSTEGEIDEPE